MSAEWPCADYAWTQSPHSGSPVAAGGVQVQRHAYTDGVRRGGGGGPGPRGASARGLGLGDRPGQRDELERTVWCDPRGCRRRGKWRRYVIRAGTFSPLAAVLPGPNAAALVALGRDPPRASIGCPMRATGPPPPAVQPLGSTNRNTGGAGPSGALPNVGGRESRVQCSGSTDVCTESPHGELDRLERFPVFASKDRFPTFLPTF